MKRFLFFLASWNLSVQDSGEVDDMLVEWKNADPKISRSVFAHAICGVELAVPWLKKQLTWSRTVLTDWDVVGPTAHHLPLPRGLTLLLACCMGALGFGKLGAAVVIAQALGLRPNEMLKLCRGNVVLPETMAFGCRGDAILNLGMKKGTKSKRAQAVVLQAGCEPALTLLRWLVWCADEFRSLVDDLTLDRVNRVLARLCELLGLPKFTAHSARAGFATECMLKGMGFVETREKGRWLHDASLRVYLDAVQTASSQSSAAAQAWSEVIAELERDFLAFFPGWPGCPHSASSALPPRLRAALAPLMPRKRSLQDPPKPPRLRAIRRVTFAADA